MNRQISDFPIKNFINNGDLFLLESLEGNYHYVTASGLRQYILGQQPEVILLLPMNSNFNNIATGNNVTPVNNPTIDTVNFVFGNGSGLFNGINQYILANWIPPLLEGIDKWIIQGWGRIATDQTVNRCLFAFNTSTGGNRLLLYNRPPGANGGLRLIADPNVDGLFVANLSSIFFHFCLSKDGNTFRVFIDGSVRTTVTNLATIQSSDTFSIGQEFDSSTPTDFWQGNIDDFQIIRNHAVISNFTPPINPYSPNL